MWRTAGTSCSSACNPSWASSRSSRARSNPNRSSIPGSGAKPPDRFRLTLSRNARVPNGTRALFCLSPTPGSQTGPVVDCARSPVRLACAMTIRRQWMFGALFLCAWLGACTPTAEGNREEQKNSFYLAGKERIQAMDYAGAVESFEKSLQQNPRSVLAHFELGLVYEQHLGDYAAALYHYGKALKLRPA